MGTPILKPQRRLTSLELSAPARGALRRLKSRLGMSYTHSVERAVLLFAEAHLPEPMLPGERAELGLAPNPPANRRRAHTIGDVTIETAAGCQGCRRVAAGGVGVADKRNGKRGAR